jgi:hypothetical protein
MRVITRGVSSVMAALAGKLMGRRTAADEKAAACCRASRRERFCGDQARDSRREARTATIQKGEDFILLLVERIYYGTNSGRESDSTVVQQQLTVKTSHNIQ